MKNTKSQSFLASSIILSLVISGGLLFPLYNSTSAAGYGSLIKPKTLSTSSKQHSKKRHQHQQVQVYLHDAAVFLNMDVTTLTNAINSGITLAQLAGQHGKTETELVQHILDPRIEKLRHAVMNGKLHTEKALQIEDRMTKYVSSILHKKYVIQEDALQHLQREHSPSLKSVAQLFRISEKRLLQELKSGKTLAHIAQSSGIKREQQNTLI